jgi:hypothetical protein
MKNRERIERLEERVTRLEERAAPQVETPTVTMPQRPWCVGDVVRLERYEDMEGLVSWRESRDARHIGVEVTITGLSSKGNIFFIRGNEKNVWPASALTLIRPAEAVAHTADAGKMVDALRAEVERLTTERDALRARIEEAEKKFAAWVNCGLWHWHAPGFSASPIWADVCDALNYPPADIAPIPQDERKESSHDAA